MKSRTTGWLSLAFVVVAAGCRGDISMQPSTGMDPSGADQPKSWSDNDFLMGTPIEGTLDDTAAAEVDAVAGGGIGAPCPAPDHRCAAGLLCVADRCAEVPCRDIAQCPTEAPCRPRCVTVVDRCGDVDCGAGASCLDGVCVPGCFPDACRGVSCETGKYCRGGQCLALLGEGDALTEQVRCAPGSAPTLEACADNPCAGVQCGPTDTCVAGECLDNPCAGVDCAGGFVCIGGQCVDSCTLPGASGGETSGGEAEQPKCTADCTQKGCGEANGCGGICKGCPAGQKCIPENVGWICCLPDCQDKACGDDNGCGGKCDGPCDEGFTCRRGECRCQPDCEGKGCGADDGCGGHCKNGCDDGEFCRTMAETWSCCRPNCTGKACGEDDGCGRRCNGPCPDSRDICRSGVCKCPRDCKDKACGAPDGCGGVCDGFCPTGEQCEKGRCEPVPPESCPCGQTWLAGSCVEICAPGTVLCGCTNCCTSSARCDPTTGSCNAIN